jgi:hypothetical protein
VEGLSAWTGIGALVKEAPCYRLWWVVGWKTMMIM